MSGKYLITGGHVVTLDDELGDFPDGAVLIEDGVIKAVGKAADVVAPDAQIIDASEGVVIPGMIDTHRHASMSLARGIGIDQHLWHFLSNTYLRWLPATSVEDMRLSAFLSGLEALDSGVTTIMDTCETFHTPEHAEAELQGLNESGVRAFFCYGMGMSDYGAVPNGRQAWEARMSHVRRMAEQNHSDATVQVAFQVSQTGTVPTSWLGDELALARELGLLCCSHSSTIPNSNLTSDVEVRADLGLLEPGHVYIHCTNLTDHEMHLIAESGGKIALSTDTDVSMGIGYPPLRQALSYGLRPSLSIDNSGFSPPDILSQMRLQLQVQRALDHDAEHAKRRIAMTMDLTSRDALIWGTRNGAETVGLQDKIGTLTPGKRADVVILTSKRALTGWANPVGTAIMHSTPADVDFVMVGGKIRKQHGQLTDVDVPAIRREARQGLLRFQEDLKRMRPEMSDEEIRNFVLQGEKSCRINLATAYEAGVAATDYLRSDTS